MPGPHEKRRDSCNCTYMHGPEGDGMIQCNHRPIGRKGKRLYSRTSCIHTLMMYRETRVKQRDSGRQPFAEISIINTHQTTGDRRDRKRREGTEGMETCKENKRRRESVINCHSLLLAEIQVMMWEDDVVNGGERKC